MTIKQLLRLFAARLGYAPPVFHVSDHTPPAPETIAELAAINAGAPIILRILGTGHPPVMLEAGDVPE